MTLLGPEIDGELADEEIDRIHPPEPPAFVVAIAAGEKVFEGVPRLGRKFAGVNGFLDFCIHRATQDRSPLRA